jgi:hypothetical protein
MALSECRAEIVTYHDVPFFGCPRDATSGWGEQGLLRRAQ